MVTLATPVARDPIRSADVRNTSGALLGLSGYGQQIRLYRYSDAANYANIFGNVDTTNGYVAKFQYGDPDGTPVTLATLDKARGLTMLDGALPIGYGPSNTGSTRFAVTGGSDASPELTETPMFRIVRTLTPTTTLAGRVFADVDIQSTSTGVVAGAASAFGGRSNNYGFAVSKVMSSTGVEHSGYAAVFHATANPGTNSAVNINTVLSLAYCGPRGGGIAEDDLANNSGLTAPVISVNAESPPAYSAVGPTAGAFVVRNHLSQAIGTGSNYITAYQIYQATSGGTGTLDGGANHGLYPFPGAIRNDRYFLDLVGLSGSALNFPVSGLAFSARAMRLAPNNAIWSLNTARGADVEMMKLDTNDMALVRSFLYVGSSAVGIGATPTTYALEVTGAASTTGSIYLNDTSNAKNTIGLTVNQGAADDEIISLKSSDVAHGMTDITETDTFGLLSKSSTTDGGVLLRGLNDTSSAGLRLSGVGTTADGTYSTSGVAAVLIDGTLKSTTTQTSLGADKSILAVRDNGTARFFLDSDGEGHCDVGTAWVNFDNHDDIAVLNGLSAALARPGNQIREEFGRWLSHSRDDLEALGIVHFNDDTDGRPFLNLNKLVMVLVGAARQMALRVETLEQQLLALPSGSAEFP